MEEREGGEVEESCPRLRYTRGTTLSLARVHYDDKHH